jgi:hypothetical protein
MKTPIIIYDKGDVLIFESIEIAESYIEPLDIDAYIAYDAEGRLLRLIDKGNKVSIKSAETVPTHIDELKQVLITFLNRIGVSKDWLLQASMTELLAQGLLYKTQ